jgi:hypothetical protein
MQGLAAQFGSNCEVVLHDPNIRFTAATWKKPKALVLGVKRDER